MRYKCMGAQRLRITILVDNTLLTYTNLQPISFLDSAYWRLQSFYLFYTLAYSQVRVLANMAGTPPRAEADGPGDLLSPPKRQHLRRLSSRTAADLSGIEGPFVITPDKHLNVPSDAHETAAAMEMAKRHLGLCSSGSSTPITPTDTQVTDHYAFAFDIDGVLIRGGDPIPEAVEAMRVLNGQNEYGIKV